MLVCDRCGNNAKYHNVFVGGRYHDLCSECDKKHYELEKTFNKIEIDFMKRKLTYIKHIDFENDEV